MDNPCQDKLTTLLFSQKPKMDALYHALTKELGRNLRGYRYKGRSPYYRNKEVKKRVDAIFLRFSNTMTKEIKSNTKASWFLAEDCNDLLVKSYLRNKEPTPAAHLMARNEEALSSFLVRQSNGLRLSDRVWVLTKQAKDQTGKLLASGLIEGRSASQIAKDLKVYLKEPNKRFRRLRNEQGELITSTPKNYKTGRGVYKSSYKNALRLSRNEINIAYRTADFERKKKIDFIVGFEVHLSRSHVITDICDDMAGRYPKAFKFVGWHVNCMCYTTSKMMSKSEFIDHMKGKQIKSKNAVSKIPGSANKHVAKHAETIKRWKNKPAFIADNFKNTKEGFTLKSHVK